MKYQIVTHYAGELMDGGWKVIRASDGKVMCWNQDVKRCLRWVDTWGEVDLGR